jgi:FAD/FMN-containing dehydrogenase
MADWIAVLQAALGETGVDTGQAASDKAWSAWGRMGVPTAIAYPRSTAETAEVLKIARAAGVPVVTWGGKTGLVDGASAEGALALSMEKMNRILDIDPEAGTMTVEAGCVLQAACEAADDKGLLLPLDLGARGSATIGGNISTNAGGNRVLRYGMMRDMVLGLEAVLADGTIVSAMNDLIKNNAGYDLKQLFIGSEGTLGVVTKAVLRLRPKPVSQNTAFLAVSEFDNLPKLLRRLERDLGGTLSAFEVMWADFYQLVTTEPARGRPPLPYGQPYYVLVESLGADPAEDEPRFEKVLASALEDEVIVDAVIAKSDAERHAMWALRDDVGQTMRNGPIVTFDVSLKIREMQTYVEKVCADIKARWPASAPTMVFGHLGDGNLHVIASVGETSLEIRHAVEEIVYAPLEAIHGSISAEHGVGLQKRDFLKLSRSPAEIALMRALKATLDPGNILNPGKVLAPA